MRGLIIYSSQYGCTEQYAQWLALDTGVPYKPLAEVRPEDLKELDFLVIGSNVKIGHIQAAAWIKKHWEWIEDKRLILFSVSGTYADEQVHEQIFRTSLSEDLALHFQYFRLPGRLNKSDLHLFDRILVYMASRTLPAEIDRERLKEGFDYVDPDSLDELKDVVKYLKSVEMAFI